MPPARPSARPSAIAGQPFQTFTLLGGIVVFTVAHYLLNILYGRVIVSTAHPAKFPDAVKKACGVSPALPRSTLRLW